MTLEKKLDTYWLKNISQHKTNAILVAVSGGKDSMTLVTILLKLGFRIAIAHCNFQLRAEDSKEDEAFVRHWAAHNQVHCHIIRFDTEIEMVKLKMSVQECARLLRYNWFQSLCKEHQYNYIATAHHANDNVETLLINLCKGTGIAGLHGILPISGNIVRPLLFASREQIDQYVLEQQIPYREDISNQSTKYLRNAVRHRVIPELEAIFPKLITQINSTISNIGQVEKIYRNAVSKVISTIVDQRGRDIYVPILKLKKNEAYEQICFELFSQYGFSVAQIPEILKLLNSESGHFVASSHFNVIKNRDFLILTQKETLDSDLILITEETKDVVTNDGIFQFLTIENNIIESESNSIACIDIENIVWPLQLRRRRLGDYFYPIGMGMKKKKLSKYLIDNKVPLHIKDRIWILESGKRIAWIVAHRLDERFKVKPKTKKMLQIQFIAHK